MNHGGWRGVALIGCLATAALAQEPAAPKAAPSPQGETSPPVSASVESDSKPAEYPIPQRKPHELRTAIRAALKETAPLLKKDPIPAAERLIPLYVELRMNPDVVKEDRDVLGGILRARLLKVQAELKRRGLQLTPANQQILAQQGAPFGGPVAGAAPGPGQPPADYGQQLVDLIQKVISPASWDVNGGAGSIVYYPLLHVLVVRAGDDVHEELGGALNVLRRQ